MILQNVLHAFRDDANFMIVCLVQWLCSQPVTSPRQSMVKSFIRALEYPHQLNHTQQERYCWFYLKQSYGICFNSFSLAVFSAMEICDFIKIKNMLIFKHGVNISYLPSYVGRSFHL